MHGRSGGLLAGTEAMRHNFDVHYHIKSRRAQLSQLIRRGCCHVKADRRSAASGHGNTISTRIWIHRLIPQLS